MVATIRLSPKGTGSDKREAYRSSEQGMSKALLSLKRGADSPLPAGRTHKSLPQSLQQVGSAQGKPHSLTRVLWPHVCEVPGWGLETICAQEPPVPSEALWLEINITIYCLSFPP